MENFEIKGESPLEKVTKFCENFEGGKIFKFANGKCTALRLDSKGGVSGVYDFDNSGELIEYNIANDPSGLENAVAQLNSLKEKFEVINLPPKARSNVIEKNA